MIDEGKFDRGRYTTIPETKNIRLPIGGKTRLGIKVKDERGVEYPKETDFFVCPKEVRDVFGEEPTELTVFFPSAHREEVFPQCYEKYGSNEALLCQGDGEVSKTAQRLNLENGRWEKVKCPCEHYNKKYDKKTKIGGCVKAGYLKFMIPSVSIGTFYQCRVGGTVSVEECNSAFELAKKTTGGCWAMIPFRMRRVAKKLKIPGTAKMKNHWVVTLEPAASAEEIRRVIAGEILYLGQRRGKKYELETTGPAEGKEDEAVIEPDTEGEIRKREIKEEEQKVGLKEDIEESRAREAQLKKDEEEGKGKLKSYQESKAIHKKKVEEENKLLEAILEKAAGVGMDSFEKLVEFAIDKGIFTAKLNEPLAKKVLTTNKKVYNQLMEALEPSVEGDKTKLNKIFEKFREAGMDSWEEIAYYACSANLVKPGSVEEEVKKIFLADPKAIEKVIEKARQASEDLPF